MLCHACAGWATEAALEAYIAKLQRLDGDVQERGPCPKLSHETEEAARPRHGSRVLVFPQEERFDGCWLVQQASGAIKRVFNGLFQAVKT